MKIVSFNVNGIRAILKKDFIRDFENLDADIFCLQETKYTENPGEEFPFIPENYHFYHTVSKLRKGYSGAAVYSKTQPISVHFGLEDGKYDDEGRVITLEFENFYLICAYVPNAGEGLKRLDFRMEYEADLRNYITKLDKIKPVIYTGDLNVAHEELDIKNPATNHFSAGFTDEERSNFSQLLDLGFKDTFRELYPFTIKYSWWSYRFNSRMKDVGWRIDYFVVSNRIMEKVEDSKIHNDIFGSDHCPIELDINL